MGMPANAGCGWVGVVDVLHDVGVELGANFLCSFDPFLIADGGDRKSLEPLIR